MASCFLSAVLGFIRAKEHDVVFGPSVWLGANCKSAFLGSVVMSHSLPFQGHSFRF